MPSLNYRKSSIALVLSVGLSASALAQQHSAVSDALSENTLGLYSGADYKLVTKQNCGMPCAASKQALWYFKDDLVAVASQKASSFDESRSVFEDLAQWSKITGGIQGTRPPMLWLGSPLVSEGTLSADAKELVTSEGSLPFKLVPKIKTNLSYYDASSTAFFANKEVRVRGQLENGTFVARTLWPKSFALSTAPAYQPLTPTESVASLVRADQGGATLPLQSRTLWQKDKTLDLSGKPVLAFMLNGAQGDDDEAHGGHFAVATGRFGEKGEWDSWLVNNFYNLGSVSEKGIIASTLPMDAYLADLNSGQSWYRPSYMLVAVLKSDRAPQLYQEGINRVFGHFYRQDFHYRHATANCTGLNVDTLRTLGWAVPKEGADSTLKAAVALPYMAIKEGSLAAGQSAYDYLATERTNLYPLVAFDTIGKDLTTRLTHPSQSGVLERRLSEDLEAVIFVRIPQLPSSRAFGQAPVGSMDEYMARVPKDKKDWKIVPVDPRPFPANLKEQGMPEESAPPSKAATVWWGCGVAASLLVAVKAITKKARRSKKQG